MRFEARKVIRPLPDVSSSAAEVVAAPQVVCRATGTSVVPLDKQRGKAAMVHLHVRTSDGKPSQDAELFRAAIRAIRARCDVLIQTSTGGAVGMTADERCGPLTLTGPDRPDMATLTTGTVNFGDEVFSNPRPLVWNERTASMGAHARQFQSLGGCHGPSHL
jgi:uncharacterized protein (DUF849 family)